MYIYIITMHADVYICDAFCVSSSVGRRKSPVPVAADSRRRYKAQRKRGGQWASEAS